MLVAWLTVNTFKAKLIVKIRLEIAHNFMDLCKVWPCRWRSSWHAHWQFFFPVNVLNTYFFICKILYLHTCSAVESWTALFESLDHWRYIPVARVSLPSLCICGRFFLQLEAAPHILATDLKRQLPRQHPMPLFFFFGISVNKIIVYKIIINLLNDLLFCFSIIAIAALIIRF